MDLAYNRSENCANATYLMRTGSSDMAAGQKISLAGAYKGERQVKQQIK